MGRAILKYFLGGIMVVAGTSCSSSDEPINILDVFGTSEENKAISYKKSNPFGSGASARIVDVSPGGVQLGWGWNSLSEGPVPNLCIEFTENSHSAQERSVTVSEVSDQSDLMKQLDMSASLSVKTIAAKVSGKASFSQSVKVNSFQSTYVLDGRVDNGVRFVGPMPSTDEALTRADSEFERDRIRPRYPSGSVRLTEAARKLVIQNPVKFRRQCGDAYVSSLYSGARLYAIISYQTRDQQVRKDISAEMSGSGWGVTVDADVNKKESAASVSSKQDIKVFQSGGRGGVIEISKEGIAEMLRGLPESAAKAGKITRLAVTPYEQLPEWPAGEIEINKGELEQIIDYWGAYKTLYHDIQIMLDEPDLAKFTPSATYADLEELQDAILIIVRQLEKKAGACSDDEVACTIDESKIPDPYHYAIRLPLTDEAFKKGIAAFSTKFVRQLELRTGRYADGSDIRKKYQDELKKLKKRNAAYTLKQFEAHFNEAFKKESNREVARQWAKIRASEDFHKILVANTYVRDKANQKCLIAVDAFGCLTNAEIRRYEDLVERDLDVQLQFADRSIINDENCLTGTPSGQVRIERCHTTTPSDTDLDVQNNQEFRLTVARRIVSDGQCLTFDGRKGLSLETCNDDPEQFWAVVNEDGVRGNVSLRHGLDTRHCLFVENRKFQLRNDNTCGKEPGSIWKIG